MSLGLELLIYICLGAVAGTLSGLLGIGGGLVVVPALITIFSFQGLDTNIMQLATGTSLAIMVFTTLSGFRAHYKRGAVDFEVVKCLSLGVIFGALSGRMLSGYISTSNLSIFFVLLVTYTAYTMFVKSDNLEEVTVLKGAADLGQKQSVKPIKRKTPLRYFGLGIGFCSSLLGVGGFLAVPVLVKCNYKSQVASACTVACGFLIAITSSVVSFAGGLQGTSIARAFGSIYIPAFIGITVASVTFAPVGARIAHSISSRLHRRLFAVFLIFVTIKMSFNIFHNL